MCLCSDSSFDNVKLHTCIFEAFIFSQHENKILHYNVVPPFKAVPYYYYY